MAARTPRFAILSRTPTLYSTVRLVEAAREAGAEPLVLDTLRCSMVIQPGGSQFLYKNQPLPLPDVVVPRIGHSITGYGMAVVNQLDSMGVPVLNGAAAIARSRDKVRCLQLLSAARLDVPLTVMAHEGVDVEQLVSQVGGLPCIIKLVRGTQGVGVMLAGQAGGLAALGSALIGAHSAWYLSRASAFVSYVLVWWSMILGLSITSKAARLWPGGPAASALHEHASLLGLAFAVLCIGAPSARQDDLNVWICIQGSLIPVKSG